MKKSVTNTTLGLIALATMSFAASHAQANHDSPQRFDTPYGQTWQEREDYGPRHGQRANQHRLAEINARQAQQQDRIQQGLQNGALTRREFRALMSEQHGIRSMERDFMADGFLSPFEFKRLDRALDMAGRNIRMEKHDYDTRTSHYENARYGHRWENYR